MIDPGNWLKVDMRKSSAFDKPDEIQEAINEKLAADIQSQLRTQADPGISKAAAYNAEAIKVVSEGNRFVITSESQGDILGAAAQMGSTSKNSNLDANSIDDLFSPSSGAPQTERRSDGTTGLTYRRIELERVFSKEKKKARKTSMEQDIKSSIENNFSRRFDEVIADVNMKHIADK